eukprot:TRINITY_DN16821_c0_g1_i1.p1 TRINITY_DN16821_c0_g1~~TRINITY_DN16821_c0_g1_i1.p1  ORF type:complete len:373 (+),score=45.13 TRINITY_DN16821_c0_g1_i1:66-1184(+)
MPLKVGILGATGLVGRAAVAAVAKNDRGLELGTLVGSKASTGAVYKEVWERKEKELCDHYGDGFWKAMHYDPAIGDKTVSSFEAMLENDDDIVFSSIPMRAGNLEDRLLEAGKFVVSNSPYRRYEDEVPVVVSEVNSHILTPETMYIKSPNCCTNGIVLTLHPILEKYGIEECSLTTYQSITGRGDLKYDTHLVNGNVYPIGRTDENTEEYIKMEVRKILGDGFPISVSCQRVFVQRNHFIDVKLKLSKKPESVDEIYELWKQYNPLRDLTQSGVFSHPSHTPLRPAAETGAPRPIMPSTDEPLGMSVMVGNALTCDEMFDLRYNLVVDNIDRGAFGGPLQNAQFVLNHLKPLTMALQAKNIADLRTVKKKK